LIDHALMQRKPQGAHRAEDDASTSSQASSFERPDESV
jgi:hypothetical protein